MDAMEIQEFREYLPRLFSRLSKKARKAIVLKYWKEAKGIEIAAALKISKGRVSQLLKTALDN